MCCERGDHKLMRLAPHLEIAKRGYRPYNEERGIRVRNVPNANPPAACLMLALSPAHWTSFAGSAAANPADWHHR
jgi:hypothetical protein